MARPAHDAPPPAAYRFGPWRLSADPPLLERDGRRVSLPPQPSRALLLLVSRAGEVVTREEIETRLWDDDTFVDRTLGVNFAIRRARAVLDDDAASARWIETIPRVGYRFVGAVEVEWGEDEAATVPGRRTDGSGASVGPARPSAGRGARRRKAGLLLLPVAALVLVAATLWLSRHSKVESKSAPMNDPHPSAATSSRRLAVLPIEVSPLGRGSLASLVPEGAGPAAAVSGGISDADLLSRVLTEELLTQVTLRCAHQIGVIAMDSSIAWGSGAALDHHTPGVPDAEAPDLWLRGALAPADDDWSLTLRLWRAGDGLQLWARAFDAPPGRLPELLSAAAVDIAAALDVPPVRGEAGERGNPEQLGAIDEADYERFLQARFLTVKGSTDGDPESFDRGLAMLEETASAAPRFARGQAALAHAYLMLLGVEPLSEVTDKAAAAARRALVIDPDLAEAHTLLGTALFYGGADPAEVGAQLRRGVALGPGISKAHQLLGTWLAATGHPDEGIAELRHAVDLDPLSQRKRGDLAEAFLYAERYDESRAELERVLALEPANFRASLLMVKLELARGDEEAAEAALRRAVEAAGGPPPAGLREWIDELTEYKANRPDGSRLLERASWKALVGDEATALELLERACEAPRDAWWPFIAVDPGLRKLEGAPRFRGLAECFQR